MGAPASDPGCQWARGPDTTSNPGSTGQPPPTGLGPGEPDLNSAHRLRHLLLHEPAKSAQGNPPALLPPPPSGPSPPGCSGCRHYPSLLLPPDPGLPPRPPHPCEAGPQPSRICWPSPPPTPTAARGRICYPLSTALGPLCPPSTAVMPLHQNSPQSPNPMSPPPGAVTRLPPPS